MKMVWRKTDMFDWREAEEHLTACEKEYSVIDSAGYLILTYVIDPLRNRLKKGERTEELYHEIMETRI
jgi:hypothetical protein